jgi:hypothetical protein
MAIKDILETISAPRKHRGTDITGAISSSPGTHMHVGSSSPSVGDVGFWNGTSWSSLAPSAASTVDLTTEFVKSWANKIATEDNDMIYLRKKNGILYVMKAEVHTSGKWERLDPKDEPVIIDMHGKNLEEKLGNVDAAISAKETKEVVEEPKVIPEIPIGWYQDDTANLFKYNGLGEWDTDAKQWEKLLKLADSGTLEFIG